MKIDEVQGPPEVPTLRGQDVQRQAELQRQESRTVPPPDQVDISSAAKNAASTDPTVRAARLQSELRRGVRVDAQALAQKILGDGAIR